MARKKDFRTDPRQSVGLGRFLLTPKQRLSLLRWFLFGVMTLVALLTQDVLLSRISFRGTVMDIVPCVIIMVAVLQDAEDGSIFALAAACLYYFSGSSPGPYAIPIITAISIAMVIFRQAYLRQGFFAVLLCAALGMAAYELSVFGINLFLGYTLAQRALSMLLRALMTLAVVPVAYPVLRAIGKMGGEVWKE